MRVFNKIWFLSFLLTASVEGNIELQTSQSESYEARSTLVNPAALGFQTELNGPDLLSSFTYAHTPDRPSEFSFGVSLGYLGFGFEHLLSPTQTFNRYSFASGVPITSQVFLGTRFSTTGSEDPGLSGVHSWDLGLQYRPIKYLSLGLALNRFNATPSSWVGSVTVEPIPRLRASFDIETLSDNFGKDPVYQAMAQYEVIPGLQLGAGYHKTREFSAGLQLVIGRSTIYSYYQPTKGNEKWTGGFQSTVLPRKSFLQPASTLRVKLDSRISEEGNPGNFFAKAEPSFLSVLQRIERAGNDPKIRGVVLKIESFSLGLAAAEELNKVLLNVREKGKPVEIYLGNAGLREYIIASSATKITMEPSAELRILGPRSERFYLKGTLDKIGIQGEFLAKGEYKSAPETFTRKEPSPQSRQATLAELKNLEDGIQAVLNRSRKKLPAWKEILNFAVYSADDAKKAGLIDEVASFSGGADKLSQEETLQGGGIYLTQRLDLPSRVSVIVADGDILQKRVRLLAFAGGSQITPEKMSKRLKHAASDPRTKAIVLRVTSPGGEILASQEIASMIETAKQKKPVIISMGDMAASGGYMISAPATRIFADSLTVTGSIGVFLGKVSLEGLYKKIDLKKEMIGSSPYLGLYSEGRPWTPQERAVMVRRMNDYYGSFVNFVAEKRKLSADDAEKAAKGRVWVSNDALKLKLIDEMGGLTDAIRYAASFSHLQEGDYEVALIEEDPGLFGFGEMDTFFMKEPGLMKDALSLLGAGNLRDIQWMTSLSESPFLYWSPHTYSD